MRTVTFVVVTAALLWRAAGGSSDVAPATIDEFACRTDARRFEVTVDYRTWRSVSVRGASSSYMELCVVNVTWATSSERRHPGLAPQLLLVKVEPPQFNASVVVFSVTLPYSSRSSNSGYKTENCAPTYVWADQSVELSWWYIVQSKALTSYHAAFVVTEATNVCGLASRSGELLVQSSGSSEYAFASDSRRRELPPNNVPCAFDSNYSLTIRSSVVSASLYVTVLACPSDDSCATLLLNGRRFSDGAMVASAFPGGFVTLQYVRRICYNSSSFSGFVVSAEVYSGHRELTALNPATYIIVTAIVGTLSAAALAIGITVAFIARRQLRRALIAAAMPSGLPMSASVSFQRIGHSGIANDAYELLRAADCDQHV